MGHPAAKTIDFPGLKDRVRALRAAREKTKPRPRARAPKKPPRHRHLAVLRHEERTHAYLRDGQRKTPVWGLEIDEVTPVKGFAWPSEDRAAFYFRYAGTDKRVYIFLRRHWDLRSREV